MKSKKALKLGILVLSLGALAACGGDNGDTTGDDNQQQEEHVHKANETSWKSNSTKHWRECTEKKANGSKCNEHLQEADHEWGAEYQTQALTCEDDGIFKHKCNICGFEAQTRKEDHPGHTYEKEDDGTTDKVTWTTEPSCEVAGVGTKHCTICNQDIPYEEAEAMGHLYNKNADGEDIVDWNPAPSCLAEGIGSKTCTRPGCNHVEPIQQDPLDHKLVPIDETEPTAKDGFAKVRQYKCERCNDISFGFNADEVTPESRATLWPRAEDIDPNSTEEVGIRFFGHSIGNGAILDEKGDTVERSVAANIFDKTQTGDYFEYKFTLTQAQVDTMPYCRLYCDAKPADYMNSNGLDFWAVKGDPEENDYSHGYYIDDAPEHVHVTNPEAPADQQVKEGNTVKDYRYVLYVDDNLVEFDDEIVNMVGANDPRQEYILPYTFHFDAGDHSIKLVMAGGYRSEFYKFTFRACEEPEAKEAVCDHTFENNVCTKCNATRVVINALNDATNTLNKDTAAEGYLKLKENNDKAEYSFSAPKAGKARLYVEACKDKWDETSPYPQYFSTSEKNKGFADGNKNGNIKFTVNGVDVKMGNKLGKNYNQFFIGEESDWVDATNSPSAIIDFGSIDVDTTNTLVFTRMASYCISIKNIYIVFPAAE